MAKFFKSLFRSNSDKPVPSPSHIDLSLTYQQIEHMPFPEIVELVQSLPTNTQFQSMTALARRFYELALYDNHVPQEHREAALKLAEATTADLEKGLAENPEALAALKTANSHLIENAQKGGVGSLIWRLQEYSISGGDTIPYVMKPEHRHLVPDFLETLEPQLLARTKHHLVRELILQRSYNINNAVLILHGLATKGDKAAAALFTSDEYAALLNVPDDYDAGRRVLVSYGLLPPSSNARAFKSVTEIKGIVALILREKRNQTEEDVRAKTLSEEDKTALLLGITFLRINLTRSQLRQIYGDETASAVMTIFTDPMAKEVLSMFEEVTQTLKTMLPGTPADFSPLDTIMRIGGIEVKSEKEFNQKSDFLNMSVDWINTERVEFLDYLRFMLRAVAEPMPEIRSAADAEIAAIIRETYRRKGAQATFAEKALYYEDWIGTDE
jgi:hypothetical protein